MKLYDCLLYHNIVYLPEKGLPFLLVSDGRRSPGMRDLDSSSAFSIHSFQISADKWCDQLLAVGKLIVQIELAISIAICIALCSSDDSALLRSRSQFVPKALVSFGVCTLKIFVCKATSSTPLVLEWNFFTILYLKINQD